MPASLIKTPSPSAIAVVPLAVPPSIRFISAAVAVTPSSMFNSAAVLVTPSKILSSAAVLVTAVPPIASLFAGTLNVPLSSTVATVVQSYCLKIISFASTCGCNTP